MLWLNIRTTSPFVKNRKLEDFRDELDKIMEIVKQSFDVRAEYQA